MDSDTRKIVILAVLAFGILVFILFYIFSGMNTDDNKLEDQVGTFPIGPDRTNILPVDPITDVTTTTEAEDLTEQVVQDESVIVVKETGWQDDVIDYTRSAPNVTDAYNNESNVGAPGSSSGQDDLSLLEFSVDYRDYVPRIIQIGDRGSISFEDSQNPEKFREAIAGNLYTSIKEEFNKSRQCGTIKIPSDEKDFERFIENFDNNKAVVCMGETVVTDCSSSLLIVESQTALRMYVGRRDDGTCGFGVANNPEYLQFCNIESVVGDVNFSAWQQQYQDKPGAAFEAIYTGFSQSGASGKGYDCKIHKYN